jgi:hypothetical protein
MMGRYFPLLLVGLIAVGALMGTSAKAAETKVLFDGKSLDGWDFFLKDPDAKMADVWSVRDSMLICKGNPMGYLATKEKFKDFKLIVEWRWAPDAKPSDRAPNSGVLLRITGEKKMLPKCVEAQLMSGSAGDIWAFEGFTVKGDEDRYRAPRPGMSGLSKIQGAENDPGEWNKYEITLVGDKLTLVVNGKKVNECTGCDEVAGQIGLQSEGGEIHFKTVQITAMDE